MILLIGAPGAGKGTQADLLTKKYGYQTLSTGNALRAQIKAGSEVGLEAKKYMDEGELVPDSTILDVLKAELSDLDKDKVLLDGYPRNLEQAKTLKEMGDQFKIDKVIHLDLSEDVVIERMTGRRVCEDCGANYHIVFGPPKTEGVCDACGGKVVHRSDDHLDKIQVRLGVYKSKTKPLVEYYQQEGKYYRVEAVGSPSEINDRLLAVLEG